jgi:hypothetical protein
MYPAFNASVTASFCASLSCHVPKPITGIVAPVLSFAWVTEAMLRLCNCDETWESRDEAAVSLEAFDNMMRGEVETERYMESSREQGEKAGD